MHSVQLDCWHSRFAQTFNAPQFLRTTQELQQTVKGLIQASLSMAASPGPLIGKMLLQTVAFFINTTEWEYLIKSPLK